MTSPEPKQTPTLTKIGFQRVVHLSDGEVYAVFSDGESEYLISLDCAKSLREELSVAERAIAHQYRSIALSKNGNLF